MDNAAICRELGIEKTLVTCDNDYIASAKTTLRNGGDDMVILISAESCTGKTLMAQKLLEKYYIPYLSVDLIKMGLYRADNNCGFHPEDSNEAIEMHLWPILKGIIKTTIENGQSLIIEGCYISPHRLKEFDKEYSDNIIPVFMGFSKKYIEDNFISNILKHKGIIERRDETSDRTIQWFIEAHDKLKSECSKNSVRYFEIDNDYTSEVSEIYKWIDLEIKNYPVNLPFLP